MRVKFADMRWSVPLVLALLLAATGCQKGVDGEATAERGSVSAGPIQPAQLDQLLTPALSLTITPGKPLFETDMQSVLWTGSDPAECQGVVGYGRHPLFPTNYTGREARTQTDNQYPNQHQLLEVSATYPGDFQAAKFLDSVRAKVSACQRQVVAWGDDGKRSTVTPGPVTAGSPDMVRWSTNLDGDQWICEFTVIAKANVIAQLVTCSGDRSIDNTALSNQRLEKIEELLNSKV
ncbi:sensor domain-containing protein [Mycobacteroides saopaulense]|uniref:sensor domain-containing protein n=1 Tax=Mycobacteroides saopaulense TaxID=1578165 RepID=UPI001F3B649D|nr:sensor domain-containing protein [Mycobacteroides saopaulense]